MTPAGRVAAGLLVVVGANVVGSLIGSAAAKGALVSAELEEPPPFAVAILTLGALALVGVAASQLSGDRS